MKKLIFFMVGLFLTMSLVSCDKDKNEFGIVYDAVVEGSGEGEFQVNFPQGSLAMDGTANLLFKVSNADSVPDKVMTKAEILESGNEKNIKALNDCADFISKKFSVTTNSDAEGAYDLWIKGYIMEKMTGIKVEINKHITNQDSTLTAREINPLDYIK